MAPNVGDLAPDFPIVHRHDAPTLHKLADRGPVVVYFYPTDNTPGCTREAQDFRDLYSQFQKLKTEVVGISVQSMKSHDKFRAQHDLPFPLVSDELRSIATHYGVLNEKGTAIRTTFLIAKGGKIARIWPGKVKVAGHAAEVLEAVKGLKGSPL